MTSEMISPNYVRILLKYYLYLVLFHQHSRIFHKQSSDFVNDQTGWNNLQENYIEILLVMKTRLKYCSTLRFYNTGFKSKFRKIFEFKIIVLKQTRPLKKALIFSFKLTP